MYILAAQNKDIIKKDITLTIGINWNELLISDLFETPKLVYKADFADMKTMCRRCQSKKKHEVKIVKNDNLL